MQRTLEILDRLIAFPTVSAESNLALIDYVQTFLQGCGFSVHRVPDQTGQKAGLYARIGPDGAGLMVSAHSDVVPVAGQVWREEAFKLTRRDGRLFGRGTTDMKGYLACMLTLAERASTANLTEPLKIALSYDEEVGCVGIQNMIDALEPTIGRPRGCFVGEPTSMAVATGHKGKAAFKARFTGVAGHSALAPNFVNALHLAADFMGEIRSLQGGFAENGPFDHGYSVPYSTLHVGKLSGGTALNIVPHHAEMDFEFRHLACDSIKATTQQLQEAAAGTVAPYQGEFAQTDIEIDLVNAYPGLALSDDMDFVGFAKAMAQTNETTKVAFGTEAGVFFDVLDIPTVVCGPGDMQGQGHQPDEYVEMDQLIACNAMLGRVLGSISS